MRKMEFGTKAYFIASFKQNLMENYVLTETRSIGDIYTKLDQELKQSSSLENDNKSAYQSNLHKAYAQLKDEISGVEH
ncbi:hypothetical protein JFL43_11980 [Viridibacillus sp. YIM B01967]|uniref:Uncharacterized protein n=1 Tax=Viridibacillus soli TaxID=2798301 RepID=A0ABS1H819_9BACL|nr:hypothetical protein [Viridibacillus soli]MBK3495559.1 hypothetical protein [Viridibacillus soli]